ncbi:OLC1v1004279C1 [Oldenlandia corymbosa var. corymbosa]|uniref:OLC1v1004279C1 n=1 Tax=Oldenlandia corymbosa var. corymbosa TaxID=529605 RepID=A0AAV1DBZ3_OLDCO|nr:OLC1v1004279C1 [Oldenlandia corymbosa var. corymbosa]
MSSGSGGYAVSRSHGGDRFYNPPMRRQQQQQQQTAVLQQQQQQQQLVQLQRASKSDSSAVTAAAGGTSVEAGSRTDSDDSVAALSRPSSVRSPSPPMPPPPRPETNLTNLDRFMLAVTPVVNASEGQVNVRRRRSRDPKLQPFYCLGDLWEGFYEWSVYGVGVPLLLNGGEHVKQYYVPFLSGIQLYIDPSKLRLRTGEESDAESLRETSSGGSSDCEPDKRSKFNKEGLRNQQNTTNLDPQRLNRLSLKANSVKSSSGDEADISSSPGLLLFEFMEQEQPHFRKPLIDKIAMLASQKPELRKYRSCDLLPSSWISVAWYPIYRIPVGPTLRDLDVSFLTFHYLSTQTGGLSQLNPVDVNARKLYPSTDCSSGISLPVFGMASYKLKSSLLNPVEPQEIEQENSLVQAAGEWLQRLQVTLPDFQFFRAHAQRRV